jgi:uncharacterized DUF497 family protein
LCYDSWVKPIVGLLWDDFNFAHVARHGISVVDVEDVVLGEGRVLMATSNDRRPGRREFFGATRTGRPVMVVTEAPTASGMAYVVTARPMTPKEWRLVEEAMKND